MQLPTLPRVIFKTLIRGVLVVVFLGIPAALLSAKFLGIGFGLPESISRSLSPPGFQTTIGRISFDLVDGLVAENVTVFQTGDEESLLGRIDRIAIAPSLDELIHRRIVIERLLLDGARAEVPLSGRDSESLLSVEGLSADVSLVDDQIRIARLEAEIEGIRIRASGRLSAPHGLRLPDQPAGRLASPPPITHSPSQKSEPVWVGLLHAIKELQFSESPPTLSLEINGSLANPRMATISPIIAQSGPIIGPDWRIEGIEGRARYANGKLSIEKFTIHGKDGARAVLWASSEGSMFDFEVESSLDPTTLRGLVPALARLESTMQATGAPTLAVRGQVDIHDPAPSLSATGQLHWDDFHFRGVPVTSLDAEFAYRNGTLFLPGLVIKTPQGDVRADVFSAKNDLRMRGTSNINPSSLLPALDKKARQTLELMEFADRPEITFEVRGNGTTFRDLRGEGTLTLGRTAMRGVWIESATAKLEVANGAVTYRDFILEQKNGRGTGSFTYDFVGQQVRLEDVRSSLDPVGVLMWVDPKIAESVRPYRFNKNPSVKADGVVHMRDISKNNLRLTVDAPEGLAYDLIGRTLRFGATNATVHLDGDTVRVRVSRAKLMDGEVGFSADVSINPAHPEIRAEADVRRVDFAKLTKLYFNYDGSKGVCSGQYEFRAPLGRESLMEGNGSIRVEDGNVFAIPFLGPLSEILDKLVKGSGHDAARLATADFTVADETVTTNNLTIEGAGFSLYGKGDIFFMKDRMDMSVRINARGIPGIVLYPVSKLFEYVSTGKASKPDWRPKLIPRIGSSEP
ncbi:MAG: hypothetical protein Fur0032_21600 [Terrimicrobiaceae bacterium]